MHLLLPQSHAIAHFCRGGLQQTLNWPLPLLALGSSKLFSSENLTATNLVMYELLLGLFKQFPVAFSWKGKLCLPVHCLLYPFMPFRFLPAVSCSFTLPHPR